MGLLDFFRKKWRHSDPEVRAEAIRGLGPEDVGVLAEVARKDPEARLRRMAVKKIDDPAILKEIAARDADAGVRELARERADDLLVVRALDDTDADAAARALGEIADPKCLAVVARRTKLAGVRRAALARLKDERLVADVARRAESADARLEAVEELEDEKLLEEVALNEEAKVVAVAAVAKLRSRERLALVATRARSKAAREAARERLPREESAAASPSGGAAAVEPAKKSKMKAAPRAEIKAKRARLLQICLAAEGFARSNDWQAAEAGLADLRAQWIEVGTVPGTEALEARFERAFVLLQERKTADREAKARAAAEKAKAEEARRREAEARAREAGGSEAGRAREAAASALAEQGAASDGAARAGAREAAAPDSGRAGEGREGEGREGEGEIDEARRRKEKEAEDRRAEARARREAERAARIAELEQACTTLEALMTSSRAKPIDGALRKVRPLLREPRGPVSEAEAAARRRLAETAERLSARLVEIREAEDWKRFANVPKLEAICREAEALVEAVDQVEDKRRAPAVVKELERRWQAAGPAPRAKSKELWERFRKAIDTVHEKTREYFAKLDEERAENLKKKEELAARAEALAGSTDWRETSAELKRLQEAWKAIGPVPKEAGDAVWKRFRAACDQFFARREEHDRELDAERVENLKKKEELVRQAEALAGSTDWKETAERIKALKAEWQAVGPVPKDRADEVWKRFRAACDRFFEARKAAFAKQDEERSANLAAKVKLCEEAESLASAAETGEDVGEKVKALQAEWKKVGPVPRDESDAIWTRFRTACDRAFEAERRAMAEAVEAQGASGISGFTHRLPLEKIAAQLSTTAAGSDPEGSPSAGSAAAGPAPSVPGSPPSSPPADPSPSPSLSSDVDSGWE